MLSSVKPTARQSTINDKAPCAIGNSREVNCCAIGFTVDNNPMLSSAKTTIQQLTSLLLQVAQGALSLMARM
jgi:hypothetical protein